MKVNQGHELTVSKLAAEDASNRKSEDESTSDRQALEDAEIDCASILVRCVGHVCLPCCLLRDIEPLLSNFQLAKLDLLKA